MKCYRGITLQTGYTVPCGQCIQCRINKGRKWTTRLLLEQLFHPERSWFLTLTYNDETVGRTDDDVPTLRKKKALKWISNTIYQECPGLRYYVVGEYGDITYRPHLHMAIFPRSLSQASALVKRWTYGHTQSREMDRTNAAYLAKYTTKKLTSADDSRLKPNMEPEFRASSRLPPIGAPAIPALVHPYRRGAGAKLIEERGDVERTVRISGQIYPLDGYMLKQMRKELGIPLTHQERMEANENYLLWHEVQEAEWEPTIAKNMEDRYAKRKSQLRANTQTL